MQSFASSVQRQNALPVVLLADRQGSCEALWPPMDCVVATQLVCAHHVPLCLVDGLAIVKSLVLGQLLLVVTDLSSDSRCRGVVGLGPCISAFFIALSG